MRVCTIEYYTKDDVMWKANVLSTDIDDAISMIRKNVKNFDKIWSTEANDEIHLITDTIEELLKNRYVIDKKVVKEFSDKKETVKEVVENYKCPWCDKPFPTSKGLQVHITRMHKKD